MKKYYKLEFFSYQSDEKYIFLSIDQSSYRLALKKNRDKYFGMEA